MHMSIRRIIILPFLLLIFGQASAEPTRLLRFPDIHQDKVTFVYAGDIYVAEVSGGTARRLTSDIGMEVFPKFSPDGSQIAFSAEYNGTRQVYVMPSTGGTPKQLTWYNDVGPMPPRGGFDYRVLDWTPDGKHIMVRANRLPWGVRMGRYYLVPAAGGTELPMVIPEGGGGMFSPDGSKVVYTPIDREFRTWKRYRGGRAQDVWIYDLADNSAKQLTTNRATDYQPMWVGDEIYFDSDRDYKLNLYLYKEGIEPEKITTHEEFDVLWPSAGPRAIVYENGGYLYRYDPAARASARLDIEVTGDLPGRMPHYVNAADFVQTADLSPDGKRAVFAARGEIFTVPAKDGQIRNISKTPAAREIHVTWSPDGKSLAYLSDATGEYEVYIAPQDGSGPARQVTKGGDVWRFPLLWSPDSSKLAFGDKKQRLQYVDVGSGRITQVDHSTKNDIREYSWSPDNRYLVYVKNNTANSGGDIWLYALGNKNKHQLTSSDTNDSEPVFDPQGRYLYFASDRDFNLTFGDRDSAFIYNESTRVYAGLLTTDSPALHRPKSDEVSFGDDEDNGDDNGDDNGKQKKILINIVPLGFESRVTALNDTGGSIGALSANDKGLFYMSGQGPETELKFYDIEAEEEVTVLEGISGYVLASGGEKILYVQGEQWGIVDAAAEQSTDNGGKLDLSTMQLRIDPLVEWRQMYVDQWRILRDWFYDPNMHGNDWPAIRDQYAPLVDYVSYRADLDYIFGEIAGELNAGHNYVQSGDQPSVERLDGGLLGAEILSANGFFRIEKIYAGQAWNDQARSPLAQPGVNVAVGDYILAVDGDSTAGVDNFYRLLENKGDQVVTLTVNSRARLKGAREVMVKTVTGETGLRYLDWVDSRRAMVDKLSGGRVGYFHLPDTAFEGHRELYRLFPAQTHKDAMLIDVRYNGGGFIPDQMAEVIGRKALSYWKQRGLEPGSTPGISHEGPKAALINNYSSSGGDAFPYYFRALGLGPLIGTRTWGGLIGISGNPQLADDGGILTSTFRFMDAAGNYVVENEGVSPDYEVVDRPELVARGEDPSLEFAVKYLLEQLAKNPPKQIVAPPPPTDFH
ncbi:MAG: PDZ domain-containing protein [Gammaproteobacteria bacterium]|nr:PDZ domain-containing protein [Gammaproteobacteria bacterium]